MDFCLIEKISDVKARQYKQYTTGLGKWPEYRVTTLPTSYLLWFLLISPHLFCSDYCLLFRPEVVSNSLVTPWTLAHQASLSMGFPREEYWSGLSFPSPGDLPDPGVKLTSPPALQADSLPSEPLGKPDLADCISTHSKNKWLYAHGCEKGEALLPLVSCL